MIKCAILINLSHVRSAIFLHKLCTTTSGSTEYSYAFIIYYTFNLYKILIFTYHITKTFLNHRCLVPFMVNNTLILDNIQGASIVHFFFQKQSYSAQCKALFENFTTNCVWVDSRISTEVIELKWITKCIYHLLKRSQSCHLLYILCQIFQLISHFLTKLSFKMKVYNCCQFNTVIF